jgi:hypothetical protein
MLFQLDNIEAISFKSPERSLCLFYLSEIYVPLTGFSRPRW